MLPLLAAFGAHAHAESCIWYSHDDSIRQVQTSTNLVTRVVALKQPHRLVMNAEDCGVWTLDKHDRRILRFSAEGALELQIRVRDLHPRLDEVEQLHLDPYDQSLWVSDDRRVFHLSASGQLLGSFGAPGEIRRLRIGLDQTLWVLGKRELWRFGANGTLLASYALGRHLAGDARYFAIDNVGGLIWLGDEHELAQLKLANPAEAPLRLRLAHHITGFTLDPFTGNVWVAQKEALLAFSRAGSLAFSVDLGALGIRKPEKLAFDPVSRSLWAGAEKSVSRLTDTGQFIARFSAKDGDEALGTPAFRVGPTLTLIRPPPDALTNNPQTEFRLAYGADCNGASCGFSPSYFSSYQLSATLNNQSVGSGFQLDPSTGEASYTPPARLPEGQNSFSAQVKDGFGHSSSTISNTFTVDTIAPRFLSLSPAEGSVLQAPQAIIQGVVDDPLATVVLESLGLTQSGPAFSFPVTLQPGPNLFTLSAIDRAGNRTTLTRTLNFIPLSLTIAAPASGATLSGSSVQVSGAVQGPPNTGVTVNGVVAAIGADRFYASVPLEPGPNTLTVTAKTQGGFSVQQTVSVTSTGPAPIEVSASPQSGLAPLKVSFKAGIAAGISVQRIEADFDGNGTIDFTTTNASAPIEFTYAQPGVYAARFVTTDSQGSATVQTMQIAAQDANALDVQLKALWQGFAGALANQNRASTMQFFTAGAAPKYGPVFDALLTELPRVVASFSPPLRAELASGYAEYAIVREIDGLKRVYLIQFVLGTDGIWRIDSM